MYCVSCNLFIQLRVQQLLLLGYWKKILIKDTSENNDVWLLSKSPLWVWPTFERMNQPLHIRRFMELILASSFIRAIKSMHKKITACLKIKVYLHWNTIVTLRTKQNSRFQFTWKVSSLLWTKYIIELNTSLSFA